MIENYKRELCEDCKKSYGNGCPIWPPIQVTYNCVEFIPINVKSSSQLDKKH